MSCGGKTRKGIDLSTQLRKVSVVIGTILNECYEYGEEMLMQCDFRFLVKTINLLTWNSYLNEKLQML